MNNIAILLAVAAVAVPVTCAEASVVVNPAIGGAYSFSWSGGLGPIDHVGDTAGNSLGASDWSFFSDLDTDVHLSVTDAFTPGDAFALLIDGVMVAWQHSGIAGTGFFFGDSNIHLTGGVLYSITLNVSQDCCGGGRAFANFTPGAISVVPLPASAALFGIGLGGLAALRRRKSRI